METSRVKTLVLVGFVLGLLATGVVFALTSSDTGPVSDGVTYAAPSGATVTLDGETDVAMEQMFDVDTVNLTTTDGIVEVRASGQAAGTIHADDITGTWTTVTNIDASSADLTIDPEDKPPVTVGKDIESIQFRDEMGIENGQVDFIYSGTSGAESSVTVTGLNANTDVLAVDADANDILDFGTTDSTGSVSFASLPNSDRSVEIMENQGGPTLSNTEPNDETFRSSDITLSVDVDDPDFPTDTVTLEWYVDGELIDTTTAEDAGTYTTDLEQVYDGEIHWYVEATDETGNTDTSETATFTVDHHEPEISDIQPSGDLDAEPPEISVNVTDEDFEKDGDSVDVTIDLDGETEHTETITSDSTVSVGMPDRGQTGGEHTISVEATDEYGQTTTATQTYRVPDELFIRDETNYTKLIPADGEVRFFPGGADEGSEVFSDVTDDGIIRLTDLPVNEDFIVEIEPTDENYTQRTIWIQSIYEQQNAYVLNTTQNDTIESRFQLNDPTGRFDSESILKIQRPIEINGSLVYQTIVGDQFGTEGVTAVLQEDTRYQLRVASASFEQAVGPYRASVSENVEVSPGTSSIDLEDGPRTWQANAAIDNTTIEYRYLDPAEQTSSVTVYIHERNNESNQPVGNQTYTVNEFSGQVEVPVDGSDKEWVVNFVIERNNEQSVHAITLSNRRGLSPPLGSSWQAIVAVGMLVLLAGAFSVLNAAIGAVIVSLFGGLLYFIGFLGGATSGLAVAIAIFISVVGHLMSTTR